MAASPATLIKTPLTKQPHISPTLVGIRKLQITSPPFSVSPKMPKMLSIDYR